MAALVAVSFLLVALALGLACHGICIRAGWLSGLVRPIDGGRRLRGRPLFGANKTWRGVVAVGLGSGLGACLLSLTGTLGHALIPAGPFPALGLGFLAGTAAMLSELPNSFLKRQLDIAPGTAPGRGWRRAVFLIIDQVDMLVGWWLVVALLVPPTAALVLFSMAAWFVLHQLITRAGYALGMRATRR